MARYRQRQATAANDAMLLLGTRVVSVPEGFAALESEEWVEELGALGIAVEPRMRRLAWLKFWAVRTAQDATTVLTAVMRCTGVREEDVADAADSFRGGATRLPDHGAATPAAGENGHH